MLPSISLQTLSKERHPASYIATKRTSSVLKLTCSLLLSILVPQLLVLAGWEALLVESPSFPLLLLW